MSQDNTKLIGNPLLILREELDDWAILFDPDSGAGFGLNPVGVFIWKHLDGKHTTQDILKELRASFEDVPEEVEDHFQKFIQQLTERGFVGCESSEG